MSNVQKQSISDPERTILIVDNSLNKYNELAMELRSEGWQVAKTNERSEALRMTLQLRPSVILLNLFVSSSSTLGLITKLRDSVNDENMKIIVVTGHYSADNIKGSVKAGACDFIIEPFKTKLLIERIKYQLQQKNFYQADDLKADPAQLQSSFKLVYDCLRFMSELPDTQEGIFQSLKRIGEHQNASRVNVMLADLKEPKAIVVASSDDRNFADAAVDLERYPEVREVLLNDNIIFIKDITANPLTKNISKEVKSIDIKSMVVLPIRHRGQTLGTLSIRLGADQGQQLNDMVLKAYFMAAMALGPKIAIKKLIRQKSSTQDNAA